MDAEFLSDGERKIEARQLTLLYHDAGWWPERTEQDIEKMLDQGVYVGAWKDDKLIGFARAVTDGKFRAYIEDVVIHTSFQKKGIGMKLVLTLVEELSHIEVISLFCEKELIPFYKKNHFKYSKSQFVMHRKS